MTVTKPKGNAQTVQQAFADLNYEWLDLLYSSFQDATGGQPRWVPLGLHGRPRWDVRVDQLTVAPASTSILDARRRCVLVSEIIGCDPATAVIIYVVAGEGEKTFVSQVAGPPEDRHIAAMIIYRTLGAAPPMVPNIPAEPVEPPIADNCNLATVELPAMHPAPFSPEAAGGILGDVCRWITSTAIIPAPELSLTASIALLAGIFGRLALTPTGAGVNIYVTTLLGTAGGKGHPPKAIRALADSAGSIGAVTNGDPTSYAALERMLRKHSSTVIVMDEFGITLQDVNAKHRNAVAAGIRKFMLAVYDQANSVFDGRVYASAETKKDESPLQGPALTVLGMTTVETLYAGLSEVSVADGFLNRFLFVTAQPPPEQIRPPRLARDGEPPREIVNAIAAAAAAFPTVGNLGIAKYAVPFEGGEDGEAYRRWGEVFVWQHSTRSEIAGRAAENTLRLATLRAISRKPADPVLTAEDVEWGWAIVHGSLGLLLEGMAKHMSASPAEALRKAVLAAIRSIDEPMPYSHLMRRRGVRGADVRELDGALRWLLDSGEIIDVASRPKTGRGCKFKAADRQ